MVVLDALRRNLNPALDLFVRAVITVGLCPAFRQDGEQGIVAVLGDMPLQVLHIVEE